jgi:hypothetical protein
VLEPFNRVSEAFQIVLNGVNALSDRFDFRGMAGVVYGLRSSRGQVRLERVFT